MTVRILCAVAALAAAGVSADTVSNIYTVVVNGGTFDAPVSIADQQVEIYDAEAGTTTTAAFPDVTFKPNSIFRKRGTGYMLSSLAMSSFTGEIRIEEGAFVINTNNQMGVTTSAANAPLIVVSNGASFVMSARANTCAAKALKIYNQFLLAGDGCDNYGALCNDNETSQLDSLFYGKWTLTDDATVASARTSRFDLSNMIDFAGHVLSVRKTVNSGTMCINGANCILTNSASAISRMIVSGHSLQIQSNPKFYGDAQSEIVFTNDAQIMTYALGGNLLPWTMRFTGQHNIVPGGTSKPTAGVLSGNHWLGPVVLDGTNVVIKFNVSSGYDGEGMYWSGKISGTGRITARNTLLQLVNPTNTFAGSLVVWNEPNRHGGLALWHPWSLPPTCAGFAVTNMPVTLVSKYERYDLPPTEVYVKADTNIVFTGGSGGFAPSFRKTGPGQLDLAHPLTVTGRAEVADGTLKFTRYARAGLVAGRFQMPDRGDFYLPEGRHWTGISTAAYETPIVLTNWVECVPECFTKTSAPLGSIPADAESTGTGVGIIVMFNGYIWNRSGETQRWTFGGGMGTHLNVWVDSTSLNRYTNYRVGVKTTVNVTPGAHRFRVTSYGANRGGVVNPAGGGFTNMIWSISGTGAGFRYDPQGRDSTNCVDYVKIEDPGDGSLLTVSTNDTLTAVQDEPSFWTLRLAPGTTLDTFGNGIAVGDLEGMGLVTNSNAYFNHPMTVTNSWTVSAADVDAGGVLRMHVPLAFAAGAAFAAEDLALFPHTDEPLTLCTADAPIEGMPTFDRLATNTTRKWKLIKSVDSRSIQFQYSCGTSLILR